MLARLCTNKSLNIYSPLVTSHKFRQEEKEKEDVLYEYTTKTTSYRILECIGFYILKHRDLGQQCPREFFRSPQFWNRDNFLSNTV